jgi:hypothetical protein
MTHAYEIRHHASGEFWIYTPQVYEGKTGFYRFIGPFKTRIDAEEGIDRLVDQPIWKYDEDGDEIE